MSLIISDLKINQELDCNAMRAVSGGGFFSNFIKEAPSSNRSFFRQIKRTLNKQIRLFKRRRKALRNAFEFIQ